MVISDLVGPDETHPEYEKLSSSSLQRQLDFVQSAIKASLGLNWSKVSSDLIKAFNYHAIACLHHNAGVYRPCQVNVYGKDDDGERKLIYTPPPHYAVPSLMDEMVNELNRHWEIDPVRLGAYGLWRLNWIHPFVNGNGRTARALCYYLLSVRIGTALPRPLLPVLINRNRSEYISALDKSTRKFAQGDEDHLNPVVYFLNQIIVEAVRDDGDDSQLPA